MPKSRKIVNLSSRSSFGCPKVDFQGGPRTPATVIYDVFRWFSKSRKIVGPGCGVVTSRFLTPHTSRALTRIIVYMNPRILECYKSSSLVF